MTAFIGCEGVKWCFYEEWITVQMTLNDFTLFNGEILIVKNNLFDEFYPIPLKLSKEKAQTLFACEKISLQNDAIFLYYSNYKMCNEYILFSYVNCHYDLDVGSNCPIIEYNFYDDNKNNFKNLSDVSRKEITLNGILYLKCHLNEGKVSNEHYIISEHSKDVAKQVNIISSIGNYLGVDILLSSINYKRNMIGDEYLYVLKKYWGEEARYRNNKFYKNPLISSEVIEISQGTIIEDIVKQCKKARDDNNDYSDVIVTAPTGAGKSVLFQIPAVYLYDMYKAVTIVVCPLVALMVDQVKELNDRGIEYATFINSYITYEERENRLDGIRSGRYSLVYLSPELLLAYDIEHFVGDRKVGLIVIDEAHLVTSWGRDFRVDYWFLGDYLERMRHGSYYKSTDKKNINVPIVCLTATAVYGGRDDVIDDLNASLHLICNEKEIYIGYVKRDNIEFQIRKPTLQVRSDKEAKLQLTIAEIERVIMDNKKTIMYYPFRSSIEDTLIRINDVNQGLFSHIEKYYSGNMNSLEKDEAYSKFRDTESLVMLATKAFGMGVNIPDIVNVYHYAPTGTLADYVQEIGRAARKLPNGYAITDYLSSDMHYARTLWGLSGLKHYQIKEIIKKLYEMYESKKKRNLLFSPETFSYLFDNRDIDLKVKSGLMLLSADLLERYHFKVIAVRPKSIYTRQFITVPYTIEDVFMDKYGKYCKEMNDVQPRIEHNYDGPNTISKSGKVFELDMAALWENEFENMSFPRFKYDFFEGKLFDAGPEKIVANIKLIITYDKGYEETKERFLRFVAALQQTFNDIKREFGGRYFKLKNFIDILNKNYDIRIRKEYAVILLDIFCYDHVDLYDIPSEPWKFIERRKSDEESLSLDVTYMMRTSKSSYIRTNLVKYIEQARPNTTANNYTTYLCVNRSDTNSLSSYQLVASIMQLLSMASYELVGGKNPEVFVRINDPLKLKRLAGADSRYQNRILRQIEERHTRAVRIMNQFMAGERTSEERWDIIEQYFLGNDDVVDEKLASALVPKDEKKSTTKRRKVVFTAGDKLSDYCQNWDEASELEGADELNSYNVVLADYVNSEFTIGEVNYLAIYTWMNKKIVILEKDIDSKVIEDILADGWKCFFFGKINYSELEQELR